MKHYLWVLTFSVLCMAKNLKAQAVKSFSGSAIIEPFKLEVGYNKTTHLVSLLFPLTEAVPESWRKNQRELRTS
jgi:hypothetical protein